MTAGARLGAYELEGEIGRGGMGAVFRARAPDGAVVAIKLLSRASSPVARERFSREKKLLASLSREDGFVALVDAGEERGLPYIVMPLVGGGTLRDRLKRGPLAIEAAVALGEKLARALARAHERGIVHRDLKPENVLFTSEGEPLVADLGLAKHFAEGGAAGTSSAALSRTGELAGTAGYMAPEQARDAKSAGPAADVFALGAVLHECLSGWPAFEGRTLVEVLAKVESGHATPIANLRPETPPWLASVVERALARDPAWRYRDAAALLAALRARAEERPARSRTPLVALASFGAATALFAILALLVVRARETPVLAGTTVASPSPRSTRARDPGEEAVRKLEGAGAVTSADAPVETIVADGRRRLVELAAGKAVVYSVADAECLRAKFPSGETNGLRALALLVSGGAERRAEAARELATSRTSALRAVGLLAGESDALARDLTEAWVAQVDDAALARLSSTARKLVEVSAISSEAADAAAAPFVDFLVRSRLTLAGSSASRELASRLQDLGYTRLPPALAVAVAAYITRDNYSTTARTPDQLATAARELLARGDLTRGLPLYELAVYSRPRDEDPLRALRGLEEDERALDLLASSAPWDRALEVAAARARRGAARLRIGGRIAREGDLARFLAAARLAYAFRARTELEVVRDTDVVELERALLESGLAEELPELAALTARDPTILRAELARLSGKPERSVELLEPFEPTHDKQAALALALADLGDAAGARELVRLLKGSNASLFGLERFRADDVQRYVEARLRK